MDMMKLKWETEEEHNTISNVLICITTSMAFLSVP